MSAPEYSLRDEYGFVRGQLFSPEILFPEMMKVDLNKLGFDLRVPIFFLEGRHDQYCSSFLGLVVQSNDQGSAQRIYLV
jgi:hypothetical protein